RRPAAKALNTRVMPDPVEPLCSEATGRHGSGVRSRSLPSRKRGSLVVRSLRSLWHVRCAHFGTLAALAFVEEDEASTVFLQKRAQRAYNRPKAVPKGEARTKASGASVPHLQPPTLRQGTNASPEMGSGAS